jgi:hypothetical protein
MTTYYYNAIGTEFTEYDIEIMFDDMLDDIYGPVKIFERYEYSYARAVRELDPTLYRCALLEFIDVMVTDGELFESDPTLDTDD